MSKVESAKVFIKNLNPFVEVEAFNTTINYENAIEIINKFHYVLDGSDNPITRYIVNDACVLLEKTLVSGASV